MAQAIQSTRSTPAQHAWRQGSKYFVPGLINPNSIQRYWHDDSTYEPDCHDRSTFDGILALVHTSVGTVEGRNLTSETDDDTFAKSHFSVSPQQDGQTKSIALAIQQKRRYFDNHADCLIQSHKARWMQLLERYHVFAPALQILYDNNGGHGEHFSTCKRAGVHACSSPFPVGQPCAYHIYLKLGDWANDEHFAYVRYDFHTNSNLVLLAGTSCQEQIEDLGGRLSGIEGKVNPFIIVLALLSFWHEELEDNRGICDHHIQEIESKTGHSSFEYPQLKQIEPAQLRLTREVSEAADSVQGLARAAANVERLLQFAEQQCDLFHEKSRSYSSTPLSPDPMPDENSVQPSSDQLVSALKQVHSQVAAQKLQMEELHFRIRAQFDIIIALVSQADSKANISMALDAKQDTSVMRDITLVTYLFLPGTFLATFFSMVFLDRSETGDGIVVSKWIWLYFAFVVPITIGMGWKFRSTYWRLKDRD